MATTTELEPVMESLIGVNVLMVSKIGNQRSVVRGVIEPYVMPTNCGPTRYPSRSVIVVTNDGSEHHCPPINGTLLSITVINEEKGLVI